MNVRSITALPVFNEAGHIEPVLTEVKKYSQDIVVINDGSSDNTAEVLAKQDGITVISHPENRGYGAALRTAFEYGIAENYDVLVTIDCDGQHEPRLIPELIQAVYADEQTRIDMVSGSRYLQKFDKDSIPPEDRRRINMELTEILNERLNLSLTDSFCGFKAYRVDALKSFDIRELGYAMPLEHWVQAVAANLNIVEFPIPLVYLEEERSFGGSLDDSKKRMAYYQQVLKRVMKEYSMCGSTSEDCL